MSSMLLTKLKITTAAFLLAIVACAPTAFVGRTAMAARHCDAGKQASASQSAAQPPDKKAEPAAVKESVAGSPLRSGPPFAQVEHKSNVLCVAWAADGKWLATGANDGTVTIIDAATGKEVRSFTTGWAVSAMALSPEGKKIAMGRLAKPRQTSVWDIESGKLLTVFQGGAATANAGTEQLTFTPAGLAVIAIGIGQFNFTELAGRGAGFAMGRAGGGGCAAVAPDGSAAGWSDGQGQAQWCKTDQFGGPAIGIGANSFQPIQVGNCTCIAFGPGAKLLAIGGDGKDVQLWDLKDNKKSAALAGLEKPATQLAFSADGKTLAALSGDGTTIRLWDLTRYTIRCVIQQNRGAIGSLAISPDGKMLATTLKDGKTLFLWKANARELTHKGPPLELPAKELVALWTDLTNTDFEKADAAFRKLGTGGDSAVAFLGKQIRAIAVPDVDIKRIEKMVADLDSEKFAAREKAVRELTDLGELAIVPLQRLLDKSPSPEAKQRATLILKRIAEPALTPERLRVLDAIDLLEQMQTAKAVSLPQRPCLQ